MAVQAGEGGVPLLLLLVMLQWCMWMPGVKAFYGPTDWTDAHATFYGGADASGTQGGCAGIAESRELNVVVLWFCVSTLWCVVDFASLVSVVFFATTHEEGGQFGKLSAVRLGTSYIVSLGVVNNLASGWSEFVHGRKID
uniref:Uncharacterized protein n=1 Tax=Physcomitrium patens TaxID=3218 RepID=A0A7I3ZVF3_PHYPA